LQHRQTSILLDMERILVMCSIRITSFIGNISAKSFLNVVDQVVQGITDPDVLIDSIHGRIVNKHKREKVLQSLTGHITSHHQFLLEQSFEEYQMIIRQINSCLHMMQEICNHYFKKQHELLLTIPGVSNTAAMILIAETGADMIAFENSSKFSGWIGLRPRNDESAGKYKSTAITKGNKYLKSILVQTAWAASRTKGSYFKEKFTRLSIRKPRRKALIAIARKIAVLIWNILHYEQCYNPERLIIYEPGKVDAKVRYHQREIERLEKLL
jgi:transposase